MNKVKIKRDPLVTALVGGSTKKTDDKICFFGLVDKLSSYIMELTHYIKELSKLDIETNNQIISDLHTIVNELSKIMGIVAGSKAEFTEERILFVINLINKYKSSDEKLLKFVLPGNNLLSAKTHIVRTITRECELKFASIYEASHTNYNINNNNDNNNDNNNYNNNDNINNNIEIDTRYDYIFEYLNKLSLYFFELALTFE